MIAGIGMTDATATPNHHLFYTPKKVFKFQFKNDFWIIIETNKQSEKI